MRGPLLFVAGLIVGIVCSRRQRPPEFIDLALEIDEMATPSIFRRTIRLRSHPVSKGVAQTPC